ncbi:DUF7344 domain-containing protein [Natrialba asiatica]|uniref:DUF7344 domain-containing protein n=1 Tax=Natrialba asiatica (strain ATCC 700177 / DSM 12278 / JCM 9576 / FERM P-10747 / NBRC 102637 / 172P1) TaxID=29540 RepID=M0AVZ5_NATA1|nr:hypothetical protein [Natrialba asiatica]ELZ02856.1 hypothetical protein C481_06617 [Natrialba asiatica DSM 12278]
MRETERESTQRAVEATPSLDRVFDLLSNRRRRYALYTLYEQSDGVATIDELTDRVCTFDRQFTPSETTTAGDFQRAVRTELLHVHLPKLADAGVLEQDQRTETVRYWSQPTLEEWLEHAYHKEQRS